MKETFLYDRLRAFPQVLAALLSELDAESWKARPGEKGWPIIEVVSHLVDEESEDFPKRLSLLLKDSKQEWPPIDPEGWAVSRNYLGRDPQAQLEEFAMLRKANLDKFESRSIDWKTGKTHPQAGTLYAGDLLAAWAAHDLLHLRQITSRLYELTQEAAGEFSIEYAGGW